MHRCHVERPASQSGTLLDGPLTACHSWGTMHAFSFSLFFLTARSVDYQGLSEARRVHVGEPPRHAAVAISSVPTGGWGEHVLERCIECRRRNQQFPSTEIRPGDAFHDEIWDPDPARYLPSGATSTLRRMTTYTATLKRQRYDALPNGYVQWLCYLQCRCSHGAARTNPVLI